ncbi:uncharacterized protein LOC132750148 [Ruditapes philippinarum]|uniref:uncharacterized protein LOC132750148 n=1 Tax=Ruditapes philippinarum TaxID=129788 RepID=UPI00295A773E|nr:uncharacterized protein LOC132750148 [Ruditapes philippinarum]
MTLFSVFLYVLGHQRAIVNKAMIDRWFAGLFDYLAKEVPDHEVLKNDPRRIFNADESGFPLCFKTGKVLAEKGARNVYNVTTSNKTQLTVMVCFNAFGDYVPPLIVFPGERLRDTGIYQFPDAIYGNSANGWMDTDLFVAFLQHFSAFIDAKCINKPVLLFVNGHSTHISRAAATFCANSGIILYCLLPNATHILQPCDVGFFSPMKSSWKRQVKLWQLNHIGEALTKKRISRECSNPRGTLSPLLTMLPMVFDVPDYFR